MNRTSPRKPKRPAAKAVAAARHRDRGGILLWVGAGVVVAALIAVVAVAVVGSARNKHTDDAAVSLNKPPATTAVGRDAPPPWPAPGDAAAAVRAAGLPMLPAEGAVEHIHAHLDLVVDGRPVAVPASIGIDTAAGRISPLHTHDGTGVIHIESPVQRKFSLGELLTEWNVSLSAGNVGALRVSDGHPLRVYVNGALRQGNPAAVTFAAHDEIALVYGDTAAPPPPRYDFPAGE